MTVKELITKLEEFPPELTVEAYLNFETDQGVGSCPGAIYWVGIDEDTGRVVISVIDYDSLENCDD